MSEFARAIRLARRPGDSIGAEDFEVSDVALPTVADGEVLVRNSWMSVDPYMRLPLTSRPGVGGAIQVGDLMAGAAVGVVEQSRAEELPIGALVLSQKGWRDRFVARADAVQPLAPGVGSPSWYLGVLGLTGITAYAGIEFVLKPVAGETIFVSSAAGAVGSIACQLAKLRGARVIGSVGSDEKRAWLLNTLRVDAVVNYRSEDVQAFIRESCPNGLDCYFDNVGGSTLDAALRTLRPLGRVGLCGAISQYNDDNYRAGPSEFFAIIEKCLSVYGFNAGFWASKAGEILPALGGLLERGDLVWRETIIEGLENAPAAFASLFHGENTGKMVIRLS